MWFWRIIKEVLYNLFVEVWVAGMIVMTLLVFYGAMIIEAFLRAGYIFFGILALLLFAAAFVYIVYWYFSNHHYILGSVSILVALAVLYILYIEPYISPSDIDETLMSCRISLMKWRTVASLG